MGRRWWLAMGLVVLATACTSTPSPSPSPSPSSTTPVAGSPGTTEPVGLRVAVVLPPPGERPLTSAGTRVAADAVGSRHGRDLGEFRAVVPDPGAFPQDVTTVLAEQGYDLVCVVGEEAREIVLEVSRGFPATRFCAVRVGTAAPVEDVPENVLLLDLRMEEAAYLAGVAASAVPPPAAEDPDAATPPPPRAGFVGDQTRPTTLRQRAAFIAGFTSAPGDGRNPRMDVSATTPEELTDRATEQFEAGVPVVLVAGGIDDTGVLEAAAGQDALVIVYRDRARFEGDTPGSVLVWLLLDAGVGIDLAVGRALGGWEGGHETLGVAEEAIRPQAGAAEPSAAAFERVRAVADELRDGSRSVPGP